jgi:peptidyl-prolyl cis-trans isomerase C
VTRDLSFHTFIHLMKASLMTRIFQHLAFAIAATFAVAAASHAQPAKAGDPKAGDAKPAEEKLFPKPPKITVNGVLIPAPRYDLMAKQAVARGQAAGPELATGVKDALIRGELLSQEAMKSGLDKNPEVQAQLDMARQQILVQAYVQNWMKANPIKEEAIKAEYDQKAKELKQQAGDTEYKARHVLVKEEGEAKAVIAALKKGEDFAKLAKDKSQDPGSKDNGGQLDWSPPAAYVKPFSEAMVKLKKGQYTQEPVKTDFGYHVIKLEDSRPSQGAKIPTYDEVKNQIRQGLQQTKINEVMKDLRAKAKIDEKP